MIEGAFQKHDGDAGFDIITDEVWINCGFAIIDTNCYVENVDGIVMQRTSTTNLQIVVLPTLVDKNYKGYIRIHTYNPGESIKVSRPFAQLVPFCGDRTHDKYVGRSRE